MSAEPLSDAPGGYTLVRPSLSVATPPVLDAAQRSVVDHTAGPLLVLGGPGTGKTTTLVEAVAARAAAGPAEKILVLTFGRRMALRLRRALARRLGAGGVAFSAEPVVRTFHSYAFGLLRRAAVAAGEPEPRLLSGPEQDLTIRELIGTGLLDERFDVGWPEHLRAALRTRGFAGELRDLLARAAERGVGAAQLADWGASLGRPGWQAAARFATGYADVLALRDAAGHDTVAYDPAELVRSAIGLLADDPALLAAERDRHRFCYVDELHDTDPAQLELLELLAGDGRHVVGFGDPDSSTFGFRGADPAGVTGFPDRFPTAPGTPAPSLTLWTSWRASPEVCAATRRVAARLTGPPQHRAVRPAGPPGEVGVRLFRSATAESAYLAHALREAHLLRGVPWSAMAVVVRSTVRQLAGLRRALTVAGVPVRVDAEDLPLAAQPAVAPLLATLRCALVPGALDEAAAVALLHSPLGGADPFTERQLRQGLRALALPAGDRRASGALLLDALRRPVELAAVDRRWAAPAVRVAGLLAAARTAAARAGATALDVLWAIWSESGLAAKWSTLAARGGARGAAADRDLDAVLALFDAATRFVDRMPGAGPVVFGEHVTGQQLPGDSLAPSAERGEAVRILTAHAAKGLEWDLVAVPGVQEGAWPNLRLRGSLLGSELLVELAAGRAPDPAGDEPADPPVVGVAGERAALLDEERRLFYVATSRARRRLLVSAVAAGDGEEMPSRFVAELAGTPEIGAPAAPPRALTLPALVAELRTVVADPDAEAPRRTAAARQLARLAAAGVTGAHPASWWGMGALSDERDLTGPGERVEVSPSTVENVRKCGLRWVLERHGGANRPGVEQSVGTLVHAAAAEAGDLAALRKYLDEHWDEVEFPARWVVERKRDEADRMLDKLAEWLAGNPRRLVAAEYRFRTRLPTEPGAPGVELTGAVDRLEVDGAGRPFIVDLKTGATAPSDAAAAEHPQLAAYQVAADHDAFVDLPGVEPGAPPAGAALVQIGGSRAHPKEQRQPALADADDPQWARDMVHDAARRMAASTFTAVVNEHCRSCAVSASCPLSTHGRQVTE